MEYTKLGSTGLSVSRFGLGCMRFPADKKAAIAMVRYALDHGVNYLDTAYVYQNSEEITGEALLDGYRQKAFLATKSPLWNIQSHADFEKYLDEQLQRLRTDYFDVYLLHNMNPDNWAKVQKYDGLTFLDKMVQKGKIRHQGFSIHNTPEAFREIADAFPWEIAQIQLNILGEHEQTGIESLYYGAAKGLAMVIMEPLRGGGIINSITPGIQTLLSEYPQQRSLTDWCFRWLYDKPEVSLILSGTSTLAQLQENLHIFADSRPQVMSAQDQQLIQRILALYDAQKSVGCTACKYCLPCPQDLNIPELLHLYNNYILFGDGREITMEKLTYRSGMVSADHCTVCGVCREQCPQQLDVPALMAKVHATLA
jgi:predicted aldo/keto reductase-like oxidoreductase